MPIVTLDDMKAELGVVDDVDDALISRKIEAAQAYLETMLGYAIADEFDESPADLKMAVAMIAAHAFENREASIVGVSIASVPFGVEDIIRARRHYSFGG